MLKAISVKEAQATFDQLVEQVRSTGSRLVVKKNQNPIAVILSVQDYEDMLETIGELSDPEYLASIQEAREEYHRGDVATLEDLYAIAGETTGETV